MHFDIFELSEVLGNLRENPITKAEIVKQHKHLTSPAVCTDFVTQESCTKIQFLKLKKAMRVGRCSGEG